MSDLSAAVAPWLFGPSGSTAPGANYQTPVLSTAAGLLQRLLTWFPGDPCGPNQHLTAIAAATALTPPSVALSALLAVSGGDLFLTLDGTPASAVNGLRIPSGTLFRLTGQPSLRSASLLQVAAGTVVDVAYFT